MALNLTVNPRKHFDFAVNAPASLLTGMVKIVFSSMRAKVPAHSGFSLPRPSFLLRCSQ
jgi:hypothetical protein